MPVLFTTITGFIGCAGVIFFSGKNLAKYGDLIAGGLGLGKAWIGVILLASVTSLPELTVGISSVTIEKSANLAVGDVLGSCVFNLLILSMLDLLVKKQSLLSHVSPSQIMAGSMSIILVTIAGAGIFLPMDIIVSSWMGITSFLFIIGYFVAMRMIYKNDRRQVHDPVPEPSAIRIRSAADLQKAVGYFVLHAGIVVVAGFFLPYFAAGISASTGLGQSFVGTLFLAASTSFPEIAVSFTAVRAGYMDMAVGNLLGSNIFNILILSIDDLFYSKGHLLKDASDTNLVSVFSVIIMTSIVIAGLNYGDKAKKRFYLAADTLLILLVYVINLFLLYNLRGQ